jgi:hypothetical protein
VLFHDFMCSINVQPQVLNLLTQIIITILQLPNLMAYGNFLQQDNTHKLFDFTSISSRQCSHTMQS